MSKGLAVQLAEGISIAGLELLLERGPFLRRRAGILCQVLRAFVPGICCLVGDVQIAEPNDRTIPLFLLGLHVLQQILIPFLRAILQPIKLLPGVWYI